MGWLKKVKERRNAYDDLLYVIRTNPATAGADGWSISKLSRETAIQARKFISRNTLKHTDISSVVFNILSRYSDAETRMLIVMRNFDHAVELGWRYAPSASTFILDAIDEHRESRYSKDYTELTPEQEAALLILEDSQWDKSCTYGHSRMSRKYTCGKAAVEVTLERPQDVAAIIEVARATDVTHAAHLIAVLDGEIQSALGSGAL
jgi:hypothetical protein